MRRSCGFEEESYIMHERQSWDHPSYREYHEISSPSIHKMLHKPSFQYSSTPSSHGHHDGDPDDMAFNRSRWDDAHGWCRTHHLNSENFIVKEHQASGANYDHHDQDQMAFGGSHCHETRGLHGTHHLHNNNFLMKINEHEALGAKSILRPPLGSVNPPYHHRTMYEEGSWQPGANPDERQYFRGEGSMEQSMSMMVNKRSNIDNNNNKKWMEVKGSKKFEDYDHNNARLKEELESFIKGLHGGEVVKKIEVIEYERTSATFGGGLRVFQKHYSLPSEVGSVGQHSHIHPFPQRSNYGGGDNSLSNVKRNWGGVWA